jgi:hypothetical protein
MLALSTACSGTYRSLGGMVFALIALIRAGIAVQPYFSGAMAVEASQLELVLMPHLATLSATPREMPQTSFGRPAALAAAKAPSTPSSSIEATMM